MKIIFVFGKMDVEVKCPDCGKMVSFRKVKEHVSSTHYSRGTETAREIHPENSHGMGEHN